VKSKGEDEKKALKTQPTPPISHTIRVLWDPPNHPKLGTQTLKKIQRFHHTHNSTKPKISQKSLNNKHLIGGQ
jgi:hypothetical protein